MKTRILITIAIGSSLIFGIAKMSGKKEELLPGFSPITEKQSVQEASIRKNPRTIPEKIPSAGEIKAKMEIEKQEVEAAQAIHAGEMARFEQHAKDIDSLIVRAQELSNYRGIQSGSAGLPAGLDDSEPAPRQKTEIEAVVAKAIETGSAGAIDELKIQIERTAEDRAQDLIREARNEEELVRLAFSVGPN